MKPLNIVIVAGALLVSSGMAMADSCVDTCVSYTSSTPTTQLDYFGSGSLTPLAQEYLNLPVFDTSLGTLQSITITLTADTGTNNDTVSVNGDETGSRYLGDPSQFIIDDSEQSAASTVNLSAALQMYVLDGSQTACINSLSAPGSESTASCLVASATGLSYTDNGVAVDGYSLVTEPIALSQTTTANITGSLMSDFAAPGGGSISLPVYVESQVTDGTTTGNANITYTLAAAASATITYDYTQAPASSTPEPASMGLIGLGLVSLGLIRRRSR